MYQLALPAKKTLPAKLRSVSAIGLQQQMHIALSKVWRSVKIRGMCKTKAGVVHVPIYFLVQHLPSSFDVELPQVQVLGSSHCQGWSMLSFIPMGAGSAWQAIFK